MQNKELKQLTIVEQVEQVMNMDNLKQEVQLNKPFKLGLLFKVSIKDLLEYGKDVSVPNDFSLSYHNAVMKLREQLEEYVMDASEYDFVSVSNRELQISWYANKPGITSSYEGLMNGLLAFAKRLDCLNIQGLVLRDEGVIFFDSDESDVSEFNVLDPNNYQRELDPVMMNYRHLYESIGRGCCLRHSLDGKAPIKMTRREVALYEFKLLYEATGDEEVLQEYKLMKQFFSNPTLYK